MKPPIPSPDGTIISEKKHLEFDGKERSISYRASVFSSTRLQLKGIIFNLSSHITLGIVIAFFLLMILPTNIRPLRSFSLLQASAIIAALVLSLFLVLIPILVPAGTFIQLAVRGQNESIVINSDGVRNVAKRFPIFIVWKRVLWIIAWSGDVLLLTFGGGVLIPRHAFRTSHEADDFINAVRQFRRKARQNG